MKVWSSSLSLEYITADFRFHFGRLWDLPNEAVRFQLIFVEHDSDGCPNPIDDEDDILGVSKEFGFNDLLGNQIWATNGKAAAMIQQQNAEITTPRGMAPSMKKGLAIDKIYFEDGSEASRYHIFVGKIENGNETGSVEIDHDDIAKIRFGGIIYSALGIDIDVVDPASANFDLTKLRFQLYAQRESGTELVGETDFVAVEDLIGERASFTNGIGYITFRNISSAQFGASVIRLSDLENLEISKLEHDGNLSADSVVELAFFDPSGSYAVACAGVDQGFFDISSAGAYEISANLVSVEGQRELFGWSQLVTSLVKRTDSMKCPKPYSEGAASIGSRSATILDDFKSGNLEFDDDGGRVELK